MNAIVPATRADAGQQAAFEYIRSGQTPFFRLPIYEGLALTVLRER